MAAKKRKKAKSDGKDKGGKKIKLTAKTADRHHLYEASVQCVDADLEFFEETFRKKRGRALEHLREDFCGTAALAVEFLRQHPEAKAIGVDLDRPTLDWGIEHHVSRLGEDRDRLTLVCDDVMNVKRPRVDLVAALNFSYQIFKERETLLRYFRNVHASLVDDGMFVLDAFGGTEAMEDIVEDRKIDPSTLPEGGRLPSFTYVWEQEKFSIVDHHILCHIHFKFRDGTTLKRAFTYDWRLWTLAELQDVMRDAGFQETEVYLEGWDDEEDEADGVFKRRKQFDNMAGWVAYVVGLR